MHRPSNSSRFDHPNNIWWGALYLHTPSVLTFLLQCERPSFTPIQKIDKFIVLYISY
jgi:hypothetical protein